MSTNRECPDQTARKYTLVRTFVVRLRHKDLFPNLHITYKAGVTYLEAHRISTVTLEWQTIYKKIHTCNRLLIRNQYRKATAHSNHIPLQK